MRSINPTLFILSIVCLFLVGRVYSILIPDEYYFSFSAFMLDSREISRTPALTSKLSQPFLTAFFLMLILHWLSGMNKYISGKEGGLREVVYDQAAITFAFAAGMFALLMAWPYILLWDILIEVELARFRTLYLIAYLAYVFAFAFFAISGSETARVLVDAGHQSRWSLSAISDLQVLRPVFSAISGLVATAISAFLSGQPT